MLPCGEGRKQASIFEIIRQRLRLAKRLLESDSLAIAEIAHRTGFCNPAYFTNVFKRETGVTPKVWRKSSSAD